ncbi:MAG: hypothetical protein R6X15_06235 [Pseudomonadota bacterium]
MGYSEELIQQVWEKARGMPDHDINEWRQDECGAWLHREAYEQEGSDYGWMIINTTPGGGDVVDNLRPLHINNSYDTANQKVMCRVTKDRTDLQPTASVNHPRNKGI